MFDKNKLYFYVSGKMSWDKEIEEYVRFLFFNVKLKFQFYYAIYDNNKTQYMILHYEGSNFLAKGTSEGYIIDLGKKKYKNNKVTYDEALCELYNARHYKNRDNIKEIDLKVKYCIFEYDYVDTYNMNQFKYLEYINI